MRVMGAKPPEAPEILYFIVPEKGLKIHIFPVCCSTKTQDKVIIFDAIIAIIFDAIVEIFVSSFKGT